MINGIKTLSLVDTLYFVMRHNTEAQSIVMLNGVLSMPRKGTAHKIYANNPNFAYPVHSEFAIQIRDNLLKRINTNQNTHNIRGIAKSRHILYMSTDEVESAGESLLLYYCYRFGFTLPFLNVSLFDEQSNFIGRVDMLWNCAGYKIDKRTVDGKIHGYMCKILKGKVHNGDTLVVEFDGNVKYKNGDILAGKTSLQVIHAEKAREYNIRRCGHAVLRVRWAEFYAPKILYTRLKESSIPMRKYAHKNFVPLL
ncbi:MAG: hypothetical protein LBN22_04445 [Clostridiales Family XIII bacterium]|nr:hypothetical protein [Clostridiales Family XIII bacterium]